MENIFDRLNQTNEKQALTNDVAEEKRLKQEVQTKLPNYVKDINLFGSTDEEQLKTVEQSIRKIIKIAGTALKSYEIDRLVNSLLLEITSLGKLTPLINDQTVSEIMINAPDDIWVERGGKLEKTDVTYQNNEELMELASRIVRNIGRNIDNSNPEVDARLPDGSRVHIIVPPMARKGVTITIRKFFKEKLTINDLIEKGTMTPQMARFLKALVESKANIIVSGGTGSGKTTTLNVISNFIPDGERLITIEDSAELQLGNDHIVSLEKREKNSEGKGEMSIRRLVRASLRMRPDRIIVGEVRDETAYDLLNAMNTGHEGSMSTVHANDPTSSLMRLSNLVKEAGLGYTDDTVQTLISQAVDAVVQISRMRDGSRKITHISLVDTNEKEETIITDIFVYKPELKKENGEVYGDFVKTKNKITNRMKNKMISAGVIGEK